jgi:hypothetical protein
LVANRRKFAYPFVLLSDAYGCECKTIQAHNKCLININKCPTCRKVVSKPNLYVKTRLDYYFSWPLTVIKSNPKIIGYSKMCGAGLLVI